MKKPTLSDVLSGLQKDLETTLGDSRNALGHASSLGDATESGWLRALKAHLPKRYSADKAFAMDSRGESSDQIDIVIYDSQYSLLLRNKPDQHNQPSQLHVAAESVYAVLEVKQELNLAHVAYAGQKAASVRRLWRTSAAITYANGSHPPREPPRIIAGIVACQSAWAAPFDGALRKALADFGDDERLDLGCALVDAVF